MYKISKISYQKEVFKPIRIGIFVLKSPFFADLFFIDHGDACSTLLRFFSENYSALHLINSITYIDLLSLLLKEKIDFGLFKHIPSG